MDSKERKGNGLRQTISLEKPLHLLPLPQPEALVVLSSPRRMPQVLLPLLSRVRQQLPLPHRQRKPLRLTQRVVKLPLHLLPLPQPEALVVLSSPRRMPQVLLPLLSRVRQQLPLPHRWRIHLRLTLRVVILPLHLLPPPLPYAMLVRSSPRRMPQVLLPLLSRVRQQLPLPHRQRKPLRLTQRVVKLPLHLLPQIERAARGELSSPRRMPQVLLPLLSRVRQQLPLPHRQRKPLRLTQRVVKLPLHLLPLPQPEALVVLSSPRRMPQVLLPLLSRVRQQLPLPHRQRKPLRLTQRVVKLPLHLLPLPQPEALVVLLQHYSKWKRNLRMASLKATLQL